MKRPSLSNLSAGLWLTAALLPAGCSPGEDAAPLPGREISLFSRVEEGEGALGAHLMFWRQDDYDALRLGGSPAGKPFATADMVREIEAYTLTPDGKGTPFNTFHPYPMNPTLEYVYAVGFAPVHAFASTTGYDKITLADDCRLGLTDLLASNNTGTARGSYEEPFIADGQTDYNLARMLEFRHLTACISFRATRSEEMYKKIGVKNVMVEIVNDGNAQGLERLAAPTSVRTYANADADTWTYVVDREYVPATLSHLAPGDVVMKEGKQVARFYVNTEGVDYGWQDGKFNPFTGLTEPDTSGTPTLKVNIEATLYWIQDPSQSWNLSWENLSVSNWKTDATQTATGSRFLPGYMYEVTILFDNTSVGLKATQIPWVKNGTYYYPVWDQTTN